MANIDLTVLIPSLNEEKTIGLCIRKALNAFSKLRITGEVLVVDNGSSDQSASIAQALGAKVVFHHIRGYGSALKRGIKEASGRFIVMGDGDDTYNFSEVGNFLPLLEAGADLVVGNRLVGKIHPRAMPWMHRWIGTPILTSILRILFKVKISDVNCGLRAFKKEAIEKLDLKSNGMEFATEMFIKAVRHHLNIQEVQIEYYPALKERVSHLRTFRDGWRHLRFMLIFCPKYLFLFPGLFLSSIGLFFTILLHFKNVYLFGMPLGISSATLATGILFCGIQVTLFGIFSSILNSSRGFIETGKLERFLKKNFTLEKGLIMGAVIFLLGAAMFLTTMINIFHFANNLNYVSVSLARFAIVSVFIALLGMQLIFSSFYSSFFDLEATLK